MKIYLFILLFLTNIRGLLINPRNLNYLKYPKSFKNRIVKMDYEPFKNYKEILTVLPNFQTNIIINNWIEYINLANSSDLDYEKKAIYDFKVYLAMHKDQYNNLLLAWTPDIQLIERPVVYLIMGKFYRDCIEIHRIAQNPYYKYHLNIDSLDLLFELQKFKNYNEPNITLSFKKLHEYDIRYKLSWIFHNNTKFL